MKRTLAFGIPVVIVILALIFIFRPTNAPTNTMKDGVYLGMGIPDEKTGWQDVVAITVAGGKITGADWTGVNPKNNPKDKKTTSIDGEYGMVEKGKAQSEWHTQADLVSSELVRTNDITKLNYNAEGVPDAISGVTIDIRGFDTAARAALAGQPSIDNFYATTKNGTYHSADTKSARNDEWLDTVNVTIWGGKLVASRWDAVNPDGASKYQLSKSGEYGMVAKGGAQAEWHEQADRTAAELIKQQQPDMLKYNPDTGKPDAISGVTIMISPFVENAKKAIDSAPKT